MSGYARPYLVAPPGSVRLGPWMLVTEDEVELLGDELHGWDPEAEVPIRREGVVDLESILRRTRLPRGTPLLLLARWVSSSSGMRGVAALAAIEAGGRVDLRGSLPAGRCGGTLSIRTVLCLKQNQAAAPGSPDRAGDILYEDHSRLVLEGTAPLFPVTIVDFASTDIDPDASWCLQMGSELDRPFLAVCQLQINARDKELVTAVTAARPSDRQKALLQELQHSVAQQMLESAIAAEQETALATADWEAESLGDVLRRTLEASGLGAGLPLAPFEALGRRRAVLAGATRRAGQGRDFQ